MKLVVAFIFASIFSTIAFAQTEAAPEVKKPEAKKSATPAKTEMYDQLDGQAPSRNESWYTQWGLGFANSTYSPELSSTLNSWSRTQLALEMLGFYWPMANLHTIQGFTITGVSDNYKSPSGLTEYVLNQYLYSYSVQHYFGANVGDQWFLRGDVGIAKVLETITGSGLTYSGVSDSGFGFNLGGGYGWAVTYETRFMVTGLLGHKKIKGTSSDITISSFSILASWLF